MRATLLLATTILVQQSEARTKYLSEQYKIVSVSILADSILDTSTESPPILSRFHERSDRAVHILYDATTRALVEDDLDVQPNYAMHSRREGQVRHYLFDGQKQQEYAIGGGVNQLSLHDKPFYGHYNFLEHTGIGLKAALREKFSFSLTGSEDYTVTVSSEDGATATHGSTDSQYFMFSVQETKKGNTVAIVRAASRYGEGGPFDSLEYEFGGVTYKSVRNSDFIIFDGVVFPRRIEVTHQPSGRQEVHTITDVRINPRAHPDLFESPKIKYGARVFHYRNGDGQFPIELTNAEDTKAKDVVAVSAAIDASLESMRSIPTGDVPTASQAQNQAAASDVQRLSERGWQPLPLVCLAITIAAGGIAGWWLRDHRRRGRVRMSA